MISVERTDFLSVPVRDMERATLGEILDTGVCHTAFLEDTGGNALVFHRRYAP